jgi:hypothetical protein
MIVSNCTLTSEVAQSEARGAESTDRRRQRRFAVEDCWECVVGDELDYGRLPRQLRGTVAGHGYCVFGSARSGTPEQSNWPVLKDRRT